MPHYTLIARINAGDGKFPFVNVQFSKNHRPIPIEGATYYLRPSNARPSASAKISPQLMLPACKWMTEKYPTKCAR